jgi:hypothetical protein
MRFTLRQGYVRLEGAIMNKSAIQLPDNAKRDEFRVFKIVQVSDDPYNHPISGQDMPPPAWVREAIGKEAIFQSENIIALNEKLFCLDDKTVMVPWTNIICIVERSEDDRPGLPKQQLLHA